MQLWWIGNSGYRREKCPFQFTYNYSLVMMTTTVINTQQVLLTKGIKGEGMVAWLSGKGVGL